VPEAQNHQLSLDQQVVEYITSSSAAIEKAANAEAVAEQSQKRAAAMIPQVVDALADAGLIRENQRTKLAADLADHGRALELFVEALSEMKTASQSTAATLGRPTPPVEKRAYDSLTNAHVGARMPAGQRASDAAFMKHFPQLAGVGQGG
jgi:hypothetical protein